MHAASDQSVLENALVFVLLLLLSDYTDQLSSLNTTQDHPEVILKDIEKYLKGLEFSVITKKVNRLKCFLT